MFCVVPAGQVWLPVGEMTASASGSAVGLTVTGTTTELPLPAAFFTWTTYFTVVATVMGVPFAFLEGAVSVTGELVGLSVELSVVSDCPCSRPPRRTGSVGFQ